MNISKPYSLSYTSSDESLCITFIFILLIAKKIKKIPQYSYRFTNYFFCFIFFSLDIKLLSNVKYPEAFFHNCQTGTTIINWRHGREKVLRDYSFCEIVAFYPSPLHFATLNFLHSTIMKLLIAVRWLIHRIF